MYIFYSNSEKSGSHYLLPIYLIVPFKYISITLSELLSCTSMGNNFYQLEYSAYMQFLLLLVL